MTKWIFTDVDGTLLHELQEVPQSSRNLITHLKAKSNVHIVVTTGRSLKSAKTVLSNFFQPTWYFPGIYSDGLVVFGKDEQDIIYEHTMDSRETQALADALKSKFPSTSFYVGTRTHACITESTEVLANFCKRWTETMVPVSSVSAIEKETGCSAIFLGVLGEGKEQLDIVEAWLEENYGSQYRLLRIGDEIIYAMRPGWSKWEGIKKLAEHLDIDLNKNVITIGDGVNDIEMLRACANSVAMGNGHPLAKDAAKRVTGHILEDGWAEAIISLNV
eukprot:Blabericola_migrator_1__7022@NODE_355_length_9465_cov_113_241434_g284_i0_p3_GENE_NODE_355_length_9465_cov_113_241434_g284_i0NODE_355_length_9465_cov_113_241434_g284_i0_p3_ORF_typecomplete_len275_score50_14Hydrolase_3/PF08282_12/1e46S6PP/PF05116_13/2_1S6PP/PF05116_13/1_1e06Trehalose_PPase/PF02358_16/1_3e05HAD_2/PF13419_6/0_16HAD_2/PF13419_6/7_3HAD/PF12710_7/2_1e02HAD/PF12710_7/0_0067Hydrolase/PF00702_26/0_076Hydrolase_6/PF13344_6/0_064Hydrolase_6/PF13344_6/5_6e03DUF2717/PF10911_8/0_48DUF2717/PF10